MIKLKSLQAILCLFILLVIGCNQVPEPPSWEKIGCKTNSSKIATNKPVTTNELMVYLDTSMSMQGYVALEHRTIFRQTLQILDEVSSILEPRVKTSVCYVSSGVSAAYDSTQLLSASVNRELYVGTETNLNAAIESFATNKARFQVLLTDGVQSLRNSSADTTRERTINKRMRDLIENGWGACVIGIRSQFNGRIFSEVRPNVRQVYRSGEDVESYRPFYLYIFSPDAVALDQLVEKFIKKLLEAGIKKELINELALTSNYVKSEALAEVNIKGGHRANNNKMCYTLRIDPKVGTDQKTIEIKNIPWSSHALNVANTKDLSEMLIWEIISTYPSEPVSGARYPKVTLPKRESNSISLNLEWSSMSGRVEWSGYKLIGRLNLEKSVPLWVKDWSTDNDAEVENANKTLFIKNTLSDLWNNSTLKAEPIVEIYLRIGSKE